jgi:hypothetical protein
MAKPLVQRAIESNYDDFGKKLAVLVPENMWQVTYQFKPIVIATESELDIHRKYQRTTFAQKGSAINLAQKLNKLFDTQDFDVRSI